MLLLVKEADAALPANANFGGTYASNAYPVGGPDFAPDVLNNAYYYGVRRYPYSRDMTKNPLTFRHISDGVPLPAVAAAVAAERQRSTTPRCTTPAKSGRSMLWECYSNLLNDTRPPHVQRRRRTG